VCAQYACCAGMRELTLPAEHLDRGVCVGRQVSGDVVSAQQVLKAASECQSPLVVKSSRCYASSSLISSSARCQKSRNALSGRSLLSSVCLLERLAVELLDLVREGSTQAGGTVRRACRASSCCQR
jgi:hypothetical protein